jgi:hypothetical protein
MADLNINFNDPESSSQRSVHVIGTVAGDNTQRFVRIKLTVTESGRNDVYYRTIRLAPVSQQTVHHATYNIAIVPKVSNTCVPKEAYAFALTSTDTTI